MKRLDPVTVVAYLVQHPGIGAPAIAAAFGRPRSTVNQVLARLVSRGLVVREGAGRATTYRSPKPTPAPGWSNHARTLHEHLDLPLASRTPVPYHRAFVDEYRPNETSLLPRDLAVALHERGKLPGQLPAGTYARRVLEQLLIDLSWYSSRLEGNNKSLLDTQELFRRGRSAGDDVDATMLLNHKDAIEFIVDAVPAYGITVPVVRNIQAVLMNGLLDGPSGLGSTRTTLVNISESAYVPTQVPALIDEMLNLVAERARLIKNPLECAFFLWVNIAYLQPFEDGNKRTSRLSANLPLLLSNCAPLSFIDVSQSDYASSMLGVYEQQDVTLAVELFEWTYRRSIDRYRATVEAMGAPDPNRARYREQIGDVIRQVVVDGHPMAGAIEGLQVPAEDIPMLQAMVRAELENLAPYNCARFRLSLGKTEQWIARGRPIA